MINTILQTLTSSTVIRLFSLGFFVFFPLWSYSSPPEIKVTLQSRSFQPGEIFLIVMENYRSEEKPTGTFLNRELSFFPSPEGQLLGLAGIDLETSPGKEIVAIQGRDHRGKEFVWKQEITIESKTFPTVELKVDDRYVRLKKKDLERAAREAKELKKIFMTLTSERYFEENFISPIPGSLAARFGERRVFNGVPKAPHGGADLQAASGAPIHSPAGGKVVLANHFFYPGKIVILDHGFGLYSYYAHLSKMGVKPGDVVRKGDYLGDVGATGRVTGPHLHWGVKWLNHRIDPFALTELDLEKWLRTQSTPTPTPEVAK